MDIEGYKAHIYNAFLNAEKSISKCPPDLIEMGGMTGKKTRHLYNNLLNMPDARYLEIGTWNGSSLCSAIYGNTLKRVYAVDNWSQFGGPKEEFFANLKKYSMSTHVDFFETDFLKLDAKSMPKFNVYLFDAGHEFDDHVNALKHMYDCLDDIFIFIVDDWNWRTVRQATINAIQSLKMEVLFNMEIKTTNDDSHPEGKLCTDFYWNGVCVFLLKK
jgi:SAM-dependent methyltransferase